MSSIDTLKQQVVDIAIGRLSNYGDTFILLNTIPFWGIISFTEPTISVEHEHVFSNLSKYPQAIIERNMEIGEGEMVILESSLLKLKSLPLTINEMGIANQISPKGYMIGMPISIAKVIYGNIGRTDLRQIKFYNNVIPISESKPSLEHGLYLFTITVGLKFTELPSILEIPF
jgi:hypothetical protein